jgi:uncharacterized metal-binding protein
MVERLEAVALTILRFKNSSTVVANWVCIKYNLFERQIILRWAVPGYVGHTTANVIGMIGTTAMMHWLGWSVQDIVAVDAGIAISTLVLSPDMDLINSRSMEDWGILRVFWWPYSKLVKHRDRMHLPILGTTVRWLYVLAILVLFVVVFRFVFRRLGLHIAFDFKGDREDIFYNALYLLDVYLGAVIADALHYVLDVTSTNIRRLVPHRFRERYYRYVENHHNDHVRGMCEEDTSYVEGGRL